MTLKLWKLETNWTNCSISCSKIIEYRDKYYYTNKGTNMFIPTHKIITDYKITYQYDVPEDAEIYNSIYEFEIKDCKTYIDAYNTWVENREPGRLKDWYIDPVVKTRSQVIDQEVYNLVLAELFDGDIGVNVFVDDDDEFELEPELEGIEKILVEHQAQLKFDSKR